MIVQLWKYRHLVSSLIRRQYQLRYRQSLAGFVWAIVPPLASLAAATLVFHEVAGVEVPGSYPMFVFAGLAPWTLLSSGLGFGVPSIVIAQQMVSRLPFPRVAIPLGAIGTSLFDLAITMAAFVAFALIVGAGLPITALWFPVLVSIQLVLVVGLVLLGSALDVFMRDIRLAVPLITQLWLFLTPVMYPLEQVPEELQPLYLLNPMTGLVESYRRVLVYGFGPELELLLPAIIGAGVALLVGTWYFAATQKRFADVI